MSTRGENDLRKIHDNWFLKWRLQTTKIIPDLTPALDSTSSPANQSEQWTKCSWMQVVDHPTGKSQANTGKQVLGLYETTYTRPHTVILAIKTPITLVRSTSRRPTVEMRHICTMYAFRVNLTTAGPLKAIDTCFYRTCTNSHVTKVTQCIWYDHTMTSMFILESPTQIDTDLKMITN